MKLLATLLLLAAMAAGAQQPSYWWSQMLVKPDAQQSQQFWFYAGSGIYFTYASNMVGINSTGGGPVNVTNYEAGSNVTFTLLSPYLYQISATGGGGGGATNAYWGTNSDGTITNQSNLGISIGATQRYYFGGALGGYIGFVPGNGSVDVSGPFTAPGLISGGGGFLATSGIFTGNGSGLTNVPAATNAQYAGIATNGPNGSPLLTANQTITLSKDATGSGTTAIAVTVTNIEPPSGAGSAGQVLTLNSTGVAWSNAPSGGGSQTPWTANEDAAGHTLTNLAGLGVWHITQPTNTPPAFSLNSDGTFQFYAANGSFKPELSLSYYGSDLAQVALILGWSGNSQSLVVYNGPYAPNGGLLYTDSSGNQANVEFLNSGVVEIGPSLVIQTAAFGNGIGITNSQYSSHWFTNSTLITGVITNINIIAGTNVTVGATNVGGQLNIAINVGGLESATNAWQLNGNTLGQTNSFLGTIDGNPVNFKVNNALVGYLGTNGQVMFGSGATAPAGKATAIGYSAKATGNSSVAVGAQCMANSQDATAIGAGSSATAIGAVAIGYNNDASAEYSFAAGYFAATANEGSFVWSDSTDSENQDIAPNQFVVTASGGVYYTTGGTAGSGFNADYYEMYRAGSVNVSASATSVAVTFGAAMATASYAPNVTSGFALGAITMYVNNLTANGFTVNFSAPVVGGGTLYYTALLNQ